MEINIMIKLFTKRSNFLMEYTARDYTIKEGEIRVYIECETMHGNPATYLNTDSGYFPVANPNASMFRVANCGDTIFSKSIYNNFFESEQVFMSILLPQVQVYDRITDDL